MVNPLKTESAENVALFLMRLSIGATFLGAGLLKLTVWGVTNFVNSSSKFIPPYLPRPIGQTYLYAVPFAELTVGVLLLIGFFTRIAATIAFLMLISFTMAVTGIFKDGNWREIDPNFVYITLMFAIMVMGPGHISIDKNMAGKGRK